MKKKQTLAESMTSAVAGKSVVNENASSYEKSSELLSTAISNINRVRNTSEHQVQSLFDLLSSIMYIYKNGKTEEIITAFKNIAKVVRIEFNKIADK